MASKYNISVYEHKDTGLLMALSDELEGFIVHAHTDEEMEQKLVPALEQYMKAIGNKTRFELVRTAPPGYRPPSFEARGRMEEAA